MKHASSALDLLSFLFRAIECSEYVDQDGFWHQGKYAVAAEEFDLEARGYVEFIRADSGWPIAMRPTAKAKNTLLASERIV